ncbi:unnamed protein product (macronuclear) [Paramecium tetraurelia]|uniref:Uncharacterized protein n=1 Tax=Paramecium tetraurelia TaxID=5888 RepID=A0D831_PARTE|nr:uncharacterized protein GSPATT00014165001 [Paramecium tetraurelia]CAK79198.1 unnamed protein product [Paramecium tetraurelia]|eukprot:XP_001446595.1 hypothetical protein (macronuclear) [Paramecium tetraurelia strain d4-2]
MEQTTKIMDAIVLWTYEVDNEEMLVLNMEVHNKSDEQLQNIFDEYFHIFDFGLSYDLQYMAIFEDKTRKSYNQSRRTKGSQKSDLRVKLLDIKSNSVVFESSLLCKGFLHINFHFSLDSHYLICQGYWDGYLVIDIQEKKEFIFKNKEDQDFILQMDSINSYYLNRNKKILKINAEQINLQQEIHLKFNFQYIIYFKSFLQQFALVSTELFQYIMYLENCKVIKQIKKQVDVRTELIIFQSYVIIEQENAYQTEYTVRLLHSGRLVRRIKDLLQSSGNVCQDEFGIYKYSFLNDESPNNHYKIKIFDFLRGISKEIYYRYDSQNNKYYQISKFQGQFMYTLTLSDLRTQISCYILR